MEQHLTATLLWQTLMLITPTIYTMPLGQPHPDIDGYSVVVTVIPVPVKNAVAELARHLTVSDLTVQAQGKGIASLDAGSVSLTFSKTDTADVLPTIVQEMLRGWGTIHARAKFGSVTVVRT